MSLKYKTLAEDLRSGIRSHGKKGQRLSTEQELMQQYGVSRQTVRQALSLLLEEGLIEKRQGSGTYIAWDALPDPTASRNIAILTTSISDHTNSFLWNAQSLFAGAGYHTQLFATENRAGQERKILESLLANPVRAILAEGVRTAFPTPNQDLYEKLLELGTSILFLGNGYRSLPQISCVCSDDYEGSYLLTCHLLNRSHTKIGGIFPSDDLSGHNRYLGCLCALRDHQLPFDDRRFLWYDSSQRSSHTEPVNNRLLLSFIQTQLPDCTAVVCFNDETASQLIRELQKLHVRVPEQLSVVCFGNGYHNEISPVPITAAAHPDANLWEIAAQRLLQQLEGKAVTSAIIPLSLIKKDSANPTAL